MATEETETTAPSTETSAPSSKVIANPIAPFRRTRFQINPICQRWVAKIIEGDEVNPVEVSERLSALIKGAISWPVLWRGILSELEQFERTHPFSGTPATPTPPPTAASIAGSPTI